MTPMQLLVILFVPAIAILFIIFSSKKEEEDKANKRYEESKAAFERSIDEYKKESKRWREDFKKEFGIDPLLSKDEEYNAWCQKYNAEEVGYKIAGINFRKLDSSHTGPFSGTLRIEPDNPQDPNAVAIFRGRKKVGYIPKEYNVDVYNELLKMGGSGPCSGFIRTFLDEIYQEKFAGIVVGPMHNSDVEK